MGLPISIGRQTGKGISRFTSYPVLGYSARVGKRLDL